MAEIIVETGIGWANVREALDRATADDVIVVRSEGVAAVARARAANRQLVRTIVVRSRESVVSGPSSVVGANALGEPTQPAKRTTDH